VLLDDLPRLDIPVLVLWGTADKIFPVRRTRDATSRLEKGQLDLVQGCGHLPHFELPERATLSRVLAYSYHAGCGVVRASVVMSSLAYCRRVYSSF
jgi:pimeloyl-ACP methyl ester carboxylesterase